MAVSALGPREMLASYSISSNNSSSSSSSHNNNNYGISGGGGGADLLGSVLMSDELFCPFAGLAEEMLRALRSSGQVSTHQFCYFLCRVFESLGGQGQGPQQQQQPLPPPPPHATCPGGAVGGGYLQDSLVKLLSAAQHTPLAGELDHCGRCVLKSAALRHGGLEVLRWLQARRLLDVHVIDNREENAIFEVLRRAGTSPEEDEEVLRWILSQHVHPERQNALGLQPVHAAALHGKPEAVLQLCRAGVDANALTDGDVSPTLQQLVAFHTDDPYIMGVAGSTPLHLALYTRQVINQRLVAVLLGCGADVTAVNCRGSTPISVLFDWQSFYCPTHPLHVGSQRVWRQVVAAVVGKFGLLTLTLGARQAVSPQRWALVSSALQEDGVNMNFVPSLKTFCWLAVRRQLGGRHFQEKVACLPLPGKVRHFLTVL